MKGDEQEQKIRKHLLNIVNMERPDVKWEDIIGLDFAKKEIKEAITWPIEFPHLYANEINTSRGILLFGYVILLSS